MRAKLPIFLLTVLAIVGVPGHAVEAQIAPLTYEMRAGVAIPVQELADPDVGWAGEAGPGPSFGMDFAYAFAHYAAVYGGFSQHRFACPASGCGRDTELVATGFDAGIRFILGSGRVIPLLRVGPVSYRVEGTVPTEGGGTRSTVSHRSLGWEAGFGLTIRLTRRLVLVPGVRYLRSGADFGAVGDLPLRSVVADVGLMLGF